MRALILSGLAAAISIGAMTPAKAASNVAYLAHNGSGSTCTSTAPCLSMQTAVSVAGAGGEVICLDKGPYLGVNITFSVTISCGEGLWETARGQVSIIPSGAVDVVIEGLVSDASLAGGDNIFFNGQGSLQLHRVRSGNTTGAGADGLTFNPSGPAKLLVTDSDFYRLGTTGISAGINIKPSPGVTTEVTIERSRFQSNAFGIIADGTGGGIIRGVVRDSLISGSVNNGVTVSTTSTNVVLSLDGCTIAGNSFGLAASGANAGMLVGRSVITANNTGLFATGGAALLSYRDNRLNANTSDGTFTGTVGVQ